MPREPRRGSGVTCLWDRAPFLPVGWADSHTTTAAETVSRVILRVEIRRSSTFNSLEPRRIHLLQQEQHRLLVVSNRLPVTLRRRGDGWQSENSAGGLATAMKPILRRTAGIWVGWPGDSSSPDDAKRQAIIKRWAKEDHYAAIDLDAEVARRYYEGFANQTLWPLFHHFPSRIRFDPADWEAYVQANRHFCEAIIERHQPGDLIWVHDYHLMLVPAFLREAIPNARIGFFLHIPFPSSEVFRVLPRREELLRGMLGADLLAFQTHSHLQHFRTSLLRILGMESRIDQVHLGERGVRLEALPIGIAVEEFAGMLGQEEVAKHMAELKRRFHGRRILLAVDRLDYTKGIPERLQSYARLLERAPHLRKAVVLIQIAVPSRERIACYAELQRRVNELVGDINGRFGTPDWTPVVYIRRPVPRSQLLALYASAAVGWVAPLRDGMNLVAKEYIACQGGRDGALVLSEFAGAAAEMGEAFVVNPYDEERTAAVLERVLSLPREELRERMSALHARVQRNNVFAWSERFVSGLREAAAERAGKPSQQAAPLDTAAILDAYQSSSKRLLFLDYDGTLVPFANRPERAVPTPAVLNLLRGLASDPANCVVLISGRRRADLESWFGDMERLWLAAEHGALLRPAMSRTWEPLRPHLPPDWKVRVGSIFEHFIDRTPGSFVEEKEYSLVWHYRMADPEFGEWLANELVAMLEGMLAETELRALRGHKTVEVKPLWVNKGGVVERLLDCCTNATFRFAAGDDRTDEDLFAKLDADAWTVHIGPGRTVARYSLRDVSAVAGLLELFARTRELAADRYFTST
jgi:trehalose 6-phosphate synthase/phosphatase